MKPKLFLKGYKPRYSKTIYEITAKGQGYCLINKDDRLYLKSDLQLVGDAEMNSEQPDLEGTREGHLRDLRNRPRVVIEREEEEAHQKRVARERKPVNYVVNE